MSIIFVAGVHGVGKTTCCRKVAAITGIPHYSASSIIRTEKNSAILEQSKKVSDVEGNQALLIRGVRRILDSNVGNVFLDGHFTVLGTNGHIVTINKEIFFHLSLQSIVMFKDDPTKIYERLRERDEVSPKVHEIAAHQNIELKHSEFISRNLKIPIFILNAFDSDGLLKIAVK